jgi:hypothetical protein
MFKNKKQESNKDSENIDKLQNKLLKSCEVLREFAKKKRKEWETVHLQEKKRIKSM